MNLLSYIFNNIYDSIFLVWYNIKLLDKIPSNFGIYFELSKEWLELGFDDLSIKSKYNSKSVVKLFEKLGLHIMGPVFNQADTNKSNKIAKSIYRGF